MAERKSIMEVIRNAQQQESAGAPVQLPKAKPLSEFEQEIKKIAVTAAATKQAAVKSSDMEKIQQLLSNGVTYAHEDTCQALDKVCAEAQDLFSRISSAVDHHKNMLRREGQEIARKLEGAVLELRRTVEWLEQQTPKLRDPQPEDIPFQSMASAAALSPAPSPADFEPSDYEDNPDERRT